MSILRHYCIQNVKDGIQIRIYKIRKESVTHFRQFISVKFQLPFSLTNALSKFRYSDHDLHIETGRQMSASRINAMYHVPKQLYGDETHLLTECPAYQELRKPLLRLANIESFPNGVVTGGTCPPLFCQGGGRDFFKIDEKIGGVVVANLQRSSGRCLINITINEFCVSLQKELVS